MRVHEKRKQREAAAQAAKAQSIAVQTHAVTTKLHALTADATPRHEVPNAAATYETLRHDYDRAVAELARVVFPESAFSASPPAPRPYPGTGLQMVTKRRDADATLHPTTSLQMVTKRHDADVAPHPTTGHQTFMLPRADVVGIYKPGYLPAGIYQPVQVTGMKPPAAKSAEEPQQFHAEAATSSKALAEVVGIDQPGGAAAPKKKVKKRAQVSSAPTVSTTGMRPRTATSLTVTTTGLTVTAPSKRTPVTTGTPRSTPRSAGPATSTKAPVVTKKLVSGETKAGETRANTKAPAGAKKLVKKKKKVDG